MTVASDSKYSCLLQPLQVGNVTLKNRIFISSHTYGFFDSQGLPTEKMYHYVLERARGGAALLILGETTVNDKPCVELWGSCLSRDELIPFYRELRSLVEPYGMRLFEQLNHPGGQVWPEPGAIAFAPSPIPHVISGVVPAEMPLSMIEDYVNDFGLAAHRAKLGGLDGVELKLDQGKLHHQFLSAHFNRRIDRYGGNFEKRLNFTVETLQCIRSYVGTDFVVGVRLCAETFADASLPDRDITLKDARHIARALTRTGLLDYISVTAATNSDPHAYWQSHGDQTVPRNNFAEFSKILKRELDRPIFTASQIIHPDDAVRVITSGSADMVAMTRAHIADPAVVLKVEQGRVDDIRPCISCNQSCVGNTWVGREIRCIHNPEAGNEAEFQSMPLERVQTPKHIVIIGGGPAGMEAARVAARRGHHVVLFERENMLGGQVRIAAKGAHRSRLLEIVQYLDGQLQKLGNVEIRCGHEATADEVLSQNPDTVILATGSLPMLPSIPGIGKINALTIDKAFDERRFVHGQHVLIVDEDWLQHSLSLAEWLLDQKLRVTMVTTQEFAGKGLNLVSLTSFHSRLAERKIEFKPWSEVVRLDDHAVVIRHILARTTQTLSGIDTVVFVRNRQPDYRLKATLEQSRLHVLTVGDCVFPRGVEVAIYEGHKIGRSL
jgi:dimethylglycine catabolism A